jgi:hypothetical protein
MGWMKWVGQIAYQRPNIVSSIRSKVNQAKRDKLNYCFFEGEMLTLEQAEGLIALIIKQQLREKQLRDDKIHRESDTVQQQD